MEAWRRSKNNLKFKAILTGKNKTFAEKPPSYTQRSISREVFLALTSTVLERERGLPSAYIN